MDEIKVIKYLLDEIEKEQSYNIEFEHAKEKAQRQAEIERCENSWAWQEFMPYGYDGKPRKSIIKANAKKIRQILLKLY